MPLTAPNLTSAILSASPDLTGITWSRIVLGISQGVCGWIVLPANLAFSGVCTGVVGSGTVTGKLFITPVSLPVSASMTAGGMVGRDAAAMARSVGVGLCTAIGSTGAYQGVAAGVGTGTDVSRVSVSNGSSLVLSLAGAFQAAGITGVLAGRLATGLGPGIAAMLQTGLTGTGACTGPGGPSAAAGTSVSRFV